MEYTHSIEEVIEIIVVSRQNAIRKVNEELINMYWKIGEYLHAESKNASFGDAYIESISKSIRKEFPTLKGFDRRNLYRMKQFYETYCNNQFVSPLVSQISWTNHLVILSGTKKRH